MDIPREDAIRKRRIRRIIYILVGLVAIGTVTLGVSRLKPAAPSVDKATVWVDTVKRGPMLLEVRGLGSLVPEEILVIPAPTDGRVARRLLLPGSPVTADTVIMELTNPEQEQTTLDAEWQLKAAEAQYKSTKAQLDSTLLDQKAQAATVQSDYTEAQLNADRDVELAKRGLGSELNAKVTRAKAEALATRSDIEKQRLTVSAASAKAQLDEQQAKVEQLRALYATEESPACFPARAGGRGRGFAGTFRGSRPARGRRNPSRQGGAAHAPEGAIENPRNAGQGRADRPAGGHRHAQWHHSRPRDAG